MMVGKDVLAHREVSRNSIAAYTRALATIVRGKKTTSRR